MLQILLKKQCLLKDKVDVVVWTKENTKVFSMRSYFESIAELSSIPTHVPILSSALRLLWSGSLPMKIKVFG